jgi:hypothetical protein
MIKMSNLRGGPSQMRGGAMACAWKHIWLLIFFVLFASRQKEQKKNKVRTPLKFW